MQCMHRHSTSRLEPEDFLLTLRAFVSVEVLSGCGRSVHDDNNRIALLTCCWFVIWSLHAVRMFL